jgi:hypothetical protein
MEAEPAPKTWWSYFKILNNRQSPEEQQYLK